MRDQCHDGHPRPPRGGKKPIQLAGLKAGGILRQRKAAAHAEHAGLLEPVPDLLTRVRGINVKAAHHGKALRVLTRGIEAIVIAAAVPRRRHEDAARYTRRVHLDKIGRAHV